MLPCKPPGNLLPLSCWSQGVTVLATGVSADFSRPSIHRCKFSLLSLLMTLVSSQTVESNTTSYPFTLNAQKCKGRRETEACTGIINHYQNSHNHHTGLSPFALVIWVLSDITFSHLFLLGQHAQCSARKQTHALERGKMHHKFAGEHVSC